MKVEFSLNIQLFIGYRIFKEGVFLKKESTGYKKNWLTIIYYFTKKYSTEFEDSKIKLHHYAAELFDKDIEEKFYTDQNLRVFKKNNFYLKRYREYASELISILGRIIIKPKKQNDIVTELSTRLNIDKEEVEKIFLNRVNKRILVTATMSAGKSTLVNALIGNKIMATSNESCTAKRFTITENPTVGNQVICHYENARVRVKNDVAHILHTFKGNEINMHTKMLHMDDKYLWEIVDTPGVNSSADPDHKKLTESLIKTNDFDVLLYVMNGNHLGTHDDLQHLKFIKEHVDSEKIIFVINKVDQYRKSQDSIEESYSKCKVYLNELGFTTPIIQPISAYAAFLLKKELLNKELNEDEEEEILHFKRKFNREQYDLSGYQGLSVEKSNDTKKRLLAKCGMLAVEKLIVGKEVTIG